MGRRAVLFVVVALFSCNSTEGPGGPTVDSNQPEMDGKAKADLGPDVGSLACFGSMYPGQTVIDPDNPAYADDGKTKAEVKALFAQAKSEDNDAYRAYKAALKHVDVLECAFCDCGCNPQVGHKSAVDCFIDLHGFS